MASESRDRERTADAVRRVRQALARFPESVQLILLLCCFDGLSAREAAAMTGWDEGAVRALRDSALARLEELLSAAALVLERDSARRYVRKAYQEMIEEQEPDPDSVRRIRERLAIFSAG